MNRNQIFLFMLISSIVFTGCLKTRTMVRDDGDSEDTSTASGTAKSTNSKPSHYELEELKTEITRLSGRIEELEHNQKGMNTSETNQNVAKLDMRVNDLEKNQVLIMTEVKELKDRTNAEAAAAIASAKSAPKNAKAAKSLLQDGFTLLMSKNYDEAAEKFKAFGEQNPKGKDAAEMHFGLGEASYGQKAWKKAIVEYSKVQESFDKSPRIPASLLKIGLSFEQLGMAKEAKNFFSELVERYPKSAEAKKAQSKLKKS